jgi:RNA polymerase sigma factor (sigma-70 family)
LQAQIRAGAIIAGMEGDGDAAADEPAGGDDSSGGAANVVALSARRAGRALSGPSDGELMRAYAAGDVSAFERLYDRHEAAVYRFLLRSVGIVSVAEDLLQETWLSVVRNAAAYQPQAAFRTWLFRIARTRLIDHWRARDPATVLSLDAPLADASCDAAGPALVDTLAADERLEPHNRMMQRAQAQAVLQAVQALPPAQREVLLLHVEGDLTLAQIGEVTGVGFETAKSRLRYALDKLRDARGAWT